MPTQGAYEFKLAAAAKDGLIEDAILLKPGEWAWYRNGELLDEFLGIFACCPDCKNPMTLWRRYGTDARGHTIDAAGNISPSVLHRWPVNGVEQCGFHTQPTRLLGFVDLRKP